MSNKKNIKKYRGAVDRESREKLNGHKSAVFWLTGLSGAGKSTVAHAIEKILHDQSVRVYVFDGDNVRHGLCSDLSFSEVARTENTRRIAEVAKLFVESGTVCLCAFISPLKKDRDAVKEIIGSNDYNEILVTCSLQTCESRDVKGFYELARQGKIANYTGITAPYEVAENPDLILDTDKQSLDESVELAMDYILAKISGA